MKSGKLRSIPFLALLLCVAAASTLSAEDVSRHTISSSKYAFVSTAKDLGAVSASKPITVYLWLQAHNVDSLKELVEQQYDPTSANYHNWLTTDQFNSLFAPSKDEVATVSGFLTAHNLAVSSVGEHNLYVKARGSVADVQHAFNVHIHQFDVRGHVYRANTTAPSIEGPAGTLVSRVGGLSDYAAQTHALHRTNPETRKAFAPTALSVSPNGAFYSPYCLEAPQTVRLSTDGSSPRATYSGNSYGAPLSNSTAGTLPPCGYQPSDIQTAYGLPAIYRQRLTGAGQTDAIVDAFGSPTIASDLATFASFYGLAAPNLTIYNLGTTCTGTVSDCQGWATETTLDTEAVHTVAPGANIALVEAASDAFDDLAAGILYAAEYDLGNVISNSWGAPESELGGVPYSPFDDILLFAA
jgi:subtilase family serine protease